jgi:hypothetical protein
MKSYESSPIFADAVEHKPKWLPLGAIILLAVFGGVSLVLSIVQLLVSSLVRILDGGFLIGFITMGGVGVLFLVYLFLRLNSQAHIKQWLKQNGVRLNADFVKLVPTNARINRQRQFLAQVRWINPADGKAHHFYSGYINPKLYIEPFESKPHTVVTNPDNFDYYFVELNNHKISDY